MLTVGDLFSGIGGFSLGLERTGGFRTSFFCEKDPWARLVLRKHWPDVPIYEDIRDLRYPSVDVLAGGFPCQSISVAGQKRGFDDREKSGLWYEYRRVIAEARPRYVIVENVANLRSIGLAEVIKDLWDLGYMGEWHIISARSIGAPHLRQRCWIIAYPDITRMEGLRSPIGGEKEIPQFVNPGKERNPDTPNSYLPRLWGPLASSEEESLRWAETSASVRGRWEIEPPVCGVDDGVPEGLDESRRKERIRQLGNSIVPDIAEIIGRAILAQEDNL